MYKLLLTFLAIISLSGCASNLKQEMPEPENTRLDAFNLSKYSFNNEPQELENLINSVKINLVTDRDSFQNTITHIMSDCNLKSLKLILDKGAPLDKTNSFKDTPLSIAVAHKQVSCAQFLIEKGARINGLFSFENPLMAISAKTNYIPMMKLLMQHNVCPLDNGFLDTPLLEIIGLNEESSVLLKEYMDQYIKKYGSKCPQENPLQK